MLPPEFDIPIFGLVAVIGSKELSLTRGQYLKSSGKTVTEIEQCKFDYLERGVRTFRIWAKKGEGDEYLWKTIENAKVFITYDDE